MTDPEDKPTDKAAQVKKDAEGAMAPSQADATNDGALAIKDGTRSRGDRAANQSTNRTQNSKGDE